MLLRSIDLTTALRPELSAGETLLFVQDGVGLYQGKGKLPEYQNGQAYLTSHRACYVDNEDPRKLCVGVDLRDVDRVEFYAGFLKSSPKVTFYPKSSDSFTSPRPSSLGQYDASRGSSSPRRSDTFTRVSTPKPKAVSNATWVCPICSFSNPVPSNFDVSSPAAPANIPPCLACGIKPPLAVVKSAVEASSSNDSSGKGEDLEAGTFRCPRCTFENHPSLLSCEICGQSLVAVTNKRLDLDEMRRSQSPSPSLQDLSLESKDSSITGATILESIKFSFRAGGEKIFHERLKNALIQRQWLLSAAPPIPAPVPPMNGSPRASGETPRLVGIASLEHRGLAARKTNEVVISSAFTDLEALMTSAKEIIALAEQFASQTSTTEGGEGNALLAQSASALGLQMTATKDMLKSESVYVSELSRNLAEFLTDDSRGVLKKEGGIMSLVDLWAVFNRARGGVELVSPNDFAKAAELWDKLRLPVRLRRFRSGLLVVQGRDRTDEKTTAAILSWLNGLRLKAPATEEVVSAASQRQPVTWDWRQFGYGVTAQEAAEHFGWSVGVAAEELEMAEERGALCREQGLDGLRFWENWLVKLQDSPGNDVHDT